MLDRDVSSSMQGYLETWHAYALLLIVLCEYCDLYRLTNTQFSIEELTAICEEASAAGTYVCAHAYTPTAIKRALAAGVRSIEHGNW